MSESSAASPRPEGMLEAVEWPEKLRATAIDPGPPVRLHGYDIEGDLARHYDPADVLYLALTGELPAAEASRGLAVAMTFLASVGINEGPPHAAFLARLCNAPARAVLQVAAVGLAERGRQAIEELCDFLAWLGSPQSTPPGRYTTADPAHAQSVARLRAALPATLLVPALDHPLTRSAAIAAVLFACGIRSSDAMESVWTLAALGPTFAEAMTAKPLAFREYPMNLPRFRYGGGE
jgi:hypothetical protein